ncbi:MAG: glycosyltransferase [Hyphomicrobiales bacterium]
MTAVVIQSKPLSTSDQKLAREAKRRNIPVFLDICDSPFAKFSHNPIVSGHQLLLTKRLLRLADHLTVPTAVMKEVFEARGFRDLPISVVPDIAIPDGWERDSQHWFTHFSSEGLLEELAGNCATGLTVDTAHESYRDKAQARRSAGKPIKLLWFGLAKSKFGKMGLKSLQQNLISIAHVHGQSPVELNVVSSDERLFERLISDAPFPTHFCRWEPGKVQELLNDTDITVLPTSNDPFNRVKSANRMLLSLGMGVPVITSPHPSLEHLKDAVWTGAVAEGVYVLAHDSARYSQLMQNAQSAIEAHYSPQVLANMWCELIDHA